MIFYKKLKIHQNIVLFGLGLVIKILLGTFLSSKFLSDLFIPFANYFLESEFSNPYERFLNIGEVDYFPYPALMLYIISLPKFLLGWAFPQNPFFNLFLYHLPLLFADLSIFLILKKWLKNHSIKNLIYFYWLSPVLIYISYIHGQLDVIPICLLFISLYFLFENKWEMSALLLGLSLSTKTNIAMAYPFFLIFMISKNLSFKNISFFFCISLGSFLIINRPYVFNNAFIEMVFLNKEQEKLFDPVIQWSHLLIYIIPSALLILFTKGILLKNYNRDIFLMFLGFCFSIILLFIPPMQGWYFWIIPFLAYFYVKTTQYSFLFWGLQGFYILYFIVSKNADYLESFQFLWPEIATNKIIYNYLSESGMDADKFSGLVLTLLQTTLLMNCICIYRKGLHSYSQHKLTVSPFLIGIGGGSAVGKTTLSKALSDIFKPSKTTILHGDDMHKWERGNKKWDELTHLNPKANHLHREVEYLRKLKSGKKIYRRKYDHKTGKFTKTLPVQPNNLILFEGLHPFYLDSQNKLYDLKIFIEPEIELIYHWKIIRDKEERGYSKEKILESIRKRKFDSGKYIKAQTDKVDILIEPLLLEKIKNIGNTEEKVKVYYKLLLSNNVYMENIVENLQKIKTLKVTHEYTENNYQIVTLKGNCPFKEIVNIANNKISGLEDMGLKTPHWLKDSFGVLILIIIYYIFEKANNDRIYIDPA